MFHFQQEYNSNLAKLDDGLAESPTVMVVETKNNNKTKQKCVKIRGILKPSCDFVETKWIIFIISAKNVRVTGYKVFVTKYKLA
jgi:hypothetical protein